MNGIEETFPFVFPVLFVGMWCLVLRILSSMSGWSDLAGKFQYAEKFKGEYYRFQSARLKGVNFSGVLEMGMDQTGLYLVPMMIFRLFHQPLLIPWGELHAEPFKRFLFKGYRLTFHSFPGITLDVYKRTFEKMTRHLKAREGIH